MILNKTTDERANVKIVLANTFFKRFRGLMLKKDFNGCMVFSNLKDSSVHTLFMRFDIDVYFLDENKVVFEKATLKPYRFYRPERQAKYILETKKNKLEIRNNDELEFI